MSGDIPPNYGQPYGTNVARTPHGLPGAYRDHYGAVGVDDWEGQGTSKSLKHGDDWDHFKKPP